MSPGTRSAAIRYGYSSPPATTRLRVVSPGTAGRQRFFSAIHSWYVPITAIEETTATMKTASLSSPMT
jgi:hypothetical protein